METYSAVYYDPAGRYYESNVFVTSVTLSIIYMDEGGNRMVVNWLAREIHSFEERELSTTITCSNNINGAGKLVIRDQLLVNKIKRTWSHVRKVNPSHSMFSSVRSRLLLLVFIICAFIVAGYFLFVPWLGSRMASSVSKEWEINLGQKMFASITTSYKVDTIQTEAIQEFYRATGYNIGYPVTVTVVEQDELNAFAIPGGHIVVYSGIIQKMESSGQLAALLAHEASHIELRHSLKNLFRSMATNMFFLMIFGNHSGMAGFIISHADNLKNLRYSRELETEADNNGIELMVENGLDPVGMIRLMELLQKQPGSVEPVEFLNTHPVFDTRIANIKAQIQQYQQPGHTTMALDSTFRKLKGNW